MALASARLFVEGGAYVFITGRRQELLDAAVKEIGQNVTGVQGDAGNLTDLARLYDTVKAKKGQSDNRRIGSPNRRKLLCRNDFTQVRGAPDVDRV